MSFLGAIFVLAVLFFPRGVLGMKLAGTARAAKPAAPAPGPASPSSS